jgi:hypothetical protein
LVLQVVPGIWIIRAKKTAENDINNNWLYTLKKHNKIIAVASIGDFVVLCMKYIFIPIVVGVAIKVISRKLLQPQPEKQRKKRS